MQEKSFSWGALVLGLIIGAAIIAIAWVSSKPAANVGAQSSTKECIVSHLTGAREALKVCLENQETVIGGREQCFADFDYVRDAVISQCTGVSDESCVINVVTEFRNCIASGQPQNECLFGFRSRLQACRVQ